jgi:hypothetical protein
MYKERAPDKVCWDPAFCLPILAEAERRGLAIVKAHSHPTGLRAFSRLDDDADRELFPSVHGWFDHGHPHASVILLPDGSMLGRVVDAGGSFRPLSLITVAGDDLHVWPDQPISQPATPAFARRNEQSFGKGTIQKLAHLRIGVVGCSGTGSPLIEQLARLGVGHLTLVDPGRVKVTSLNRVLNATLQDALSGNYKVTVMKRAVEGMGLGTSVLAIAESLDSPLAVQAIAECDIVFGCMDSVDGRHLLNRLSTFYVQPYFDVGVRLEADGQGGVSQICGTVHYLKPGGSSLLSRGLFTIQQVEAAAKRRKDPKAYRRLRDEGYIAGVVEERPAVITVNMYFAAMAVTELLARLHVFRDDPNADVSSICHSLTQMQQYVQNDDSPCQVLSRHVGRGDVRPPLDMPELSDNEPE